VVASGTIGIAKLTVPGIQPIYSRRLSANGWTSTTAPRKI
jgi:hypothetical protein